MPLVQVVLVLIVVGVLLWLVDRFIPMASSIKSILNAVVVIAVVLWLLNIFGLLAFSHQHSHRQAVKQAIWQRISKPIAREWVRND